ncbi:hypothetical protein D9V84_01715 [Bacteroidetes/Chlorobi group bacterium Naka2016]|nr:MAG: hypothetical protein D9V84_01715 [Bacteroidetes/Chlorobi group bacterium Naka2016]
MKPNFRSLLLLTILIPSLFLCFSKSFSQMNENFWAKLYGEDKSDVLHTFLILQDGNVILAGWTNANINQNEDIILVRINEAGTILWQYSYFGDNLDYAQVISPTLDNNIIVGCHTGSFGAGSSDILLLKVDTDGNIIWQKTYGTYDDNAIASVIPTSDGGFLVGGWSYLGGGRSHDATVFKTDADGNLIWARHYGTKNYEGIKDMIQTSDGNFIFLSVAYSEESNDDIWLVKIDPEGNIIWQKSFGGLENENPSTILRHNGLYYIFATTNSFSDNASRDFMVMVVDENGDLQWALYYPDDYETTVINANIFKENKFLITGSAIPKSKWNSDILISIIDENGQFEKGMLFGGNESELGYCIKQFKDNWILAGGYSYSFSNGNSDIILLRTDETLNLPDGELKTIDYELSGEPQQINLIIVVTNATIDTTSLTVTDANLNKAEMNLVMRNLNVISSTDFVQKESFLQFFPNPNDNLTIKFNNSLNQSVTLVIKNVLGEDIERIIIEPNVGQISIPTRKLGNGFYAIYIEELSLFVPFILY